ncbi:VOC family protein [Pseudomonas promysalinigenes]|uniref:VOC family protein n=1 Tax=Pseudomonas promysalinigenes TaxID=485898 RepID=UPI00271C95C6
MASKWIKSLRSVSFDVPDLATAERFYIEVWNLEVAARTQDALYLRGTGGDHHILSLHKAHGIAIRKVTLRARSLAALNEIERAVIEAGGQVLVSPGALQEPGGGVGLTLRDPHGRIIQVVYGDERQLPAAEQSDRPVRLAHAVLNSHDVEASRQFFEQALDFRLSDRTRIMAFLNCDSDHHSLALGDADNDALNHVAFLMPDVDSVMRGGGRMRDAQHPIEWGPGRHGPGNNAFNYFIGPFGEVIEYTAEVEQIDESYVVGGPDDWKWPAGRVDQWGISQPPSAALKDAQRKVFFIKQ